MRGVQIHERPSPPHIYYIALIYLQGDQLITDSGFKKDGILRRFGRIHSSPKEVHMKITLIF